MNDFFHFNEITTQFHFLRPLWFIALLPLAGLLFFAWRKEKYTSDWQSLIATEFLPYLLEQKQKVTKSGITLLVAFIWLMSVLALAGPSWHKRPSPIEKNQDALVILLDLSPSMLSQDLRPTRLARAKLKITDLLRERSDGQTALVAYAGDAHLVTPLSDDNNTLLNLLPSLDPTIMPTPGSNTEAAINLAIQLLRNAGAARGNILLITDGVVGEAFPAIESQILASPYKINILGVGSNQATPIANAQGGYVRDAQGAIVTTQLNGEELRSLAHALHGQYLNLTPDNSDIQSLLSDIAHPIIDANQLMKRNSDDLNQRDFDEWNDEGIWFVILLLPFVLYCFRRGFLSLLLPFIFSGFLSGNSPQAEANTLDNFLTTRDQQAQAAFQQGDSKKAAQTFENPEWRAAAEYKAGDYAKAAADYAKFNSADADYNRGNALAKSGNLEDALKAYDQALSKNPNLTDAKKNRDLIKSLQDQKKDQKNNQSQKDQAKNDQQNSGQSQKNDQSQQDQSSNNQQSQNSDSKNDQSKGDQSKNSDSEKNESKNKDAQNQKNENQQGQQNSSSKNQPQSAADKNPESATDKNKDQQNQAGQNSSAGHSADKNAAMNQNASSQNNQTSSTSGALAQQGSSEGDKKQADKAQAEKNLAEQKAEQEKLKKQMAQAKDPYEEKMTQQERDALQQWLRQVPDDPGGLLRNKFKWQSIRKQEQQNSGAQDDSQPAQQRW